MTPVLFAAPPRHLSARGSSGTDKLLRCIFAVLRNRTPYRDPATDYEALLVHRNAPRWLRKLHQFDILVRNQDGTFAVHWPAGPNRSTAPTP